MEHQVPAEHLVRVHLGGRRDPAQQCTLLARSERPDRGDMELPVQRERLVDRTVQMDGQLGYPQQRFVDLDEPGPDPAARRAHREPPGDAQVAVEPGVQRNAAVDLHADLPPARRRGVGSGLDPQVRGIGVCADDPERGVRRGALGDVPGDQRTTAGDEAAAGRARPVVRAAQFTEARLLQALGGTGHRVVRGGAGADEGQQVVGVAAVGKRRHRASAFPVFDGEGEVPAPSAGCDAVRVVFEEGPVSAHPGDPVRSPGCCGCPPALRGGFPGGGPAEWCE